MKKLFNSKFLFILASSLVVLILLVVGALYLFDDKDDVFVKSGYVLNPLSSQSEKFYFDENAGYKENLSSMIEFVDVDENKVSIVKDSFVHYLDDSLSFLKKGAILDLDSIDDSKVVSFYNITDELIIEKKDNGYVIESRNGDIRLKNFVGRISDDKYIVVGDLNLKMAGNATSISGEYFEIVYVEEGIVNIENKDVKYQVAADNTFIYVGSDKVIDLGNKKITVNGNDVMSITAITIDGDENIEIIPKGNKDEEDKPADDEQGEQGGENNNQDNQVEVPGDGNGEVPGGDVGDGDGNDFINGEEEKEEIISLKDAVIGSTDINVTFYVTGNKADDLFKLQVVNLSTGRTVNVENFPQVLNEVEIPVSLLTPNTKYLFMVINEKDNGKYFQKVFETNGFGVKLERAYATSDSLAYNIIVEEGSDIANARLTLKKFNEDSGELEPVVDKEFKLSSLENIEGEHLVPFDGLDSDTIYTAVLDEFSVVSTNFKDIYNVSVSSMTLKKTPDFDKLDFIEDVNTSTFSLFLDNIKDPDNAIVSYTYMIYDAGNDKYDKSDDFLAIDPPITTNNASPITVNVGTKKNELKYNRDYYYNVIIEYFDNEKYIEYVTLQDSVNFGMGDDPYITVEPDDELISHDSIGGTITLRDHGCDIPLVEREDCNENPVSLSLKITPYELNGPDDEHAITEPLSFEIDEEGKLKKEFYFSGLQQGVKYAIEVLVNRPDILKPGTIEHTENSAMAITTLSLSSFDVKWIELGSNDVNVVNTGIKFSGIEGSGSMSPEDSVEEIKEIVISFYEGDVAKTIKDRVPMLDPIVIPSDRWDKDVIKKEFYGGTNGFAFSTSDTLRLTMEQLKKLSRIDTENLNEFYTIKVDAYYDLDRNDPVNLVSNVKVYQVNPLLIGGQVDAVLKNFTEDKYLIKKEDLTDIQLETIGSNLISPTTVVGYALSGSVSMASSPHLTPKKLHFYVYDKNTKEKLNFYYEDEDGSLKLTTDKRYSIDWDVNNGEFLDDDDLVKIYMADGMPYGYSDGIMRRGNQFIIGYELEAVDKDGKSHNNPTPLTATSQLGYTKSPSGYGVYREDKDKSTKEPATLGMYIASSTATSVTYNYELKDPDNAVYKEEGSEDYYFYITLPNGTVKKHAMKKVDNSKYNQFAGSTDNNDAIVIEGLKSGDVYSLSYKADILKTSGGFESDVKSYLGKDVSSGKRLFDGYYDLGANAGKYNFNYQIINNSSKDNRVIIKLLVNDDLLDRILSYEIKFEDSKGTDPIIIKTGDKFNNDEIGLSLCPDASSTALPKCISIDYTYIKEMKSSLTETNDIKVTVTAVYDNGLNGFDFKVGEYADADYPYMIFQQNSTDLGVGPYVVIYSGTNSISSWKEGNGIKGYYTYEQYSNGNIYYYNSRYKCDDKDKKCRDVDANLSNVSLGATGYTQGLTTLNAKMVSVDNMSCKATTLEGDCNTFSFSSITPKVKVGTDPSKLLNGANVTLKLSGVSIEDIKKEDGEYYLYIETWDKSNKAGLLDSNGNFLYKTVRPTKKQVINKDSPMSDIVVTIDGLEDGITYYYVVYAYMLKGLDSNGKPRYERTQLYDAKFSDRFETSVYNFTTATYDYVFTSKSLSFTSLDEPYGNRKLETKMVLSHPDAWNFDLTYVFCNENDETCGPYEGDTNIFKKEISLDEYSIIKPKTTYLDITDISKYDLEFGKDYTVLIYAKVDYYDPETHTSGKRYVGLTLWDSSANLRSLVEPTFKVTRDAVSVIDTNGKTAIDFVVVPDDGDKTLVNGKYKVKLTDKAGNLVGAMQLKDENGNYYDVSNYHEHLFDATVTNQNIRITGLDLNTEYKFIAYGDAFMNNYDVNVPKEDRIKEVGQPDIAYTIDEYGVAFGAPGFQFTNDSLIVTFTGASNYGGIGLKDENGKLIQNYKNSNLNKYVREVHYTIGLYTNDRADDISGEYKIGVNDKYFEISTNADYPKFTIQDEKMNSKYKFLIVGRTYFVSIKFKVFNPITNEIVIVDSRNNPDFEPKAGVLYEKISN